MSATFIVTTPRAEFDALKYQGILVTERFDQIKSTLEKNLGPEFAAILAQPFHTQSGDDVDWYSAASGPVASLTSLPASRQQEIKDKIGQISAHIKNLAKALKNSPDNSSATRGHILELALNFPSYENVYLVGDQPVITCWGFVPASMGLAPEDLVREGEAARAPVSGVGHAAPPREETAPLPATEEKPATAKEDKKRPGFAGWWANLGAWLRHLLAILLGLALAFLVLLLLSHVPACQGKLPALWQGCSLPQSQAPPTDKTEEPAALPPAAEAQAPPAEPTAPSTETQAPPAETGIQPAEPPASSAQGRGAPPLATAPPVSRELQDAIRREAELRAELDRLRLLLMQRAAECVTPEQNAEQPPRSPQQPPSTPAPAPEVKIELLLPESREAKPEQVETPKPEEPKPEQPTPEEPKPEEHKPEEPKPEEPKPEEPKPDEPLAIPPEAAREKDLSFLKGCWINRSALYSRTDNSQITAEYCFDEKGNGTRVITQADGSRCAGPVRARFDASGKLVITSDGAPCNLDKGAYVPQRIECRGQGDSTNCVGRETGGSNEQWQAEFRRR